MSGLLQVRAGVLGATLLVTISIARAQGPAGKADAGGMPAPTPELERGRAVYVLNACHFCHGIDLTGAQMGATDLMHAPIVAGEPYFTAQCSACHARADFAGVAAKYSAADLRSRLLRPGGIPAPAGSDAVAAGRRQHLFLLERYTDADVRNVRAFLREFAH